MSDQFDSYDDDDDQDQDQGQQASNPVKDLRAKIRRLEKEAKERETELAELREFKTVTEATGRKSAVAKAFESLGLPQAYSELYPADAEGTEEAVKAFALKYGWVQATEEESQVEEKSQETFRPVTPDGSVPPSRTIKAEDLLKMSPREAAAAIAQGRVSDLAPRNNATVNQNGEAYDW